VTLATRGTRRTIRKLRFQVDAGIRIPIKRCFNPSIRKQTLRLDIRGNGPSLELNHSSEYVFFKTRRKFEATLLNSEIIRCRPALFKTQYSTDHTYFPTQIATLSKLYQIIPTENIPRSIANSPPEHHSPKHQLFSVPQADRQTGGGQRTGGLSIRPSACFRGAYGVTSLPQEGNFWHRSPYNFWAAVTTWCRPPCVSDARLPRRP